MTKFKFPLESALKLRRLQAESETLRFKELNLQRSKLQQSLTSAHEEREQASAFIHRSQSAQCVDLRALSSFTLGVEARAKALKEALARMDRQIEEQRLRLLKAEQNLRALTKLRETRFQEWRLQADRETEITAQELWLCSHTTEKDGARRR